MISGARFAQSRTNLGVRPMVRAIRFTGNPLDTRTTTSIFSSHDASTPDDLIIRSYNWVRILRILVICISKKVSLVKLSHNALNCPNCPKYNFFQKITKMSISVQK